MKLDSSHTFSSLSGALHGLGKGLSRATAVGASAVSQTAGEITETFHKQDQTLSQKLGTASLQFLGGTVNGATEVGHTIANDTDVKQASASIAGTVQQAAHGLAQSLHVPDLMGKIGSLEGQAAGHLEATAQTPAFVNPWHAMPAPPAVHTEAFGGQSWNVRP